MLSEIDDSIDELSLHSIGCLELSYIEPLRLPSIEKYTEDPHFSLIEEAGSAHVT